MPAYILRAFYVYCIFIGYDSAKNTIQKNTDDKWGPLSRPFNLCIFLFLSVNFLSDLSVFTKYLARHSHYILVMIMTLPYLNRDVIVSLLDDSLVRLKNG